MHAQYLALIKLNLRLQFYAEASFSLLLILFGGGSGVSNGAQHGGDGGDDEQGGDERVRVRVETSVAIVRWSGIR